MTTVLDIYRRYGVHFMTEGDRHTRLGWANCACPFCVGKAGLHLGVHLTSVFWTCWRCGPKRAVETLSRLCRVDQAEALDLWRSIAPFGGSMRRDAAVQKRISIHGYRRPSDVTELLPRHARYLEGRGFAPDEIAAMWGVRGTGPTSYLDGIDYRHRLFIPISWEGQEVSFQTRDFTGRSALKYVTCPMDREVVHHKHILYAHPDGMRRRWGIAVEGVTDAWRFGDCAFATFGIGYKDEQLLEIVKRYDRVAVAFDGGDGERAATRQARRLCARLRAAGVEVLPLSIDGDPGGMEQDDADAVVRDVRRWVSSSN